MHSSGRHFQAALASLLLALLLAAPAQAKAPSGAIPTPYISDYTTRGTDCPGWRVKHGTKWVRWQTYAAGFVGSRFATVASRGKLCALARSAGKRALVVSKAGWTRDPFPATQVVKARGREESIDAGAPAGWRCYALPSQWGLHAAQLAAQAGEPFNVGSGAFGAAQGLVNQFGYCVSGRASRDVDGDGKWHGGEFVAWGPSIARCDMQLALRGEEDKDGSTIYPPFYHVVGFPTTSYNTAPC